MRGGGLSDKVNVNFQMLTGRGRKEEEGEQEKFFFSNFRSLVSVSFSLLPHFPIFPVVVLLFFHPKKGLFFSSSSTILLATARPAQAGRREVGGNKRRAEPIALQRGCRCQRGPPPPPLALD